MKHFVDARGLACPLPVVNTKNEISTMTPGEVVEVLVDNEIALQNLTKFAAVRGHAITGETISPNQFKAVITVGAREEASSPTPVVCRPNAKTDTVVVLSSDRMGHGDEALGKSLMRAFVFALTRQDTLPSTVLLYNSGAFLSCEGSDCLEDLKLLQAEGVRILTCGTCLDFYDLTNSLAVGEVTNMYDIVEVMSRGEKIIKP